MFLNFSHERCINFQKLSIFYIEVVDETFQNGRYYASHQNDDQGIFHLELAIDKHEYPPTDMFWCNLVGCYFYDLLLI